MNEDSEDVEVAGLEENMRGTEEHFNENILSVIREASGLYLLQKTQPTRNNIRRTCKMFFKLLKKLIVNNVIIH